MSGRGWQAMSRYAALLATQAARRASHAAASTSAPTEAAGSSALGLRLRHGGQGGGGSGGSSSSSSSSWARGASTSAAPAAQAAPDTWSEEHDPLDSRAAAGGAHELDSDLLAAHLAGRPGLGEAQTALVNGLFRFHELQTRVRRGKFRSFREDEIHYSLAPLQSMTHDTEEQRAENFRQWGRQLEKETSVLREAVEGYERELRLSKQRGDAAGKGPPQDVMRQWFQEVTDAIEREQEQIMDGEKGLDRDTFGPYLGLLEPKYLAVIALHGMMNKVLGKPKGDKEQAGRVLAVRCFISLGQAVLQGAAGAGGTFAVQQQVQLEQLKRKVRKDNQRRRDLSKLWEEGKLAKEEMAKRGFEEFSPFDADTWRSRFAELGETLPPDSKAWFKEDSEFAKRVGQTRDRWSLATSRGSKRDKQRKLRRHAMLSLGEDSVWPPEVMLKVGGKLVDLLINSAKVTLPGQFDGEGKPKVVPAFQHDLKYEKQAGVWKRKGYVTCHPEVFRQIEANEQVAKTAFPKFKPMLVPPVPWRKADLGAHLTVRSCVMRTREQRANRQLLDDMDRRMAAGEPGCLQVYKALNVLGAVPWRINAAVLRVVEQAWEAGGGVADLPLKIESEEAPPKPNPSHRFGTVSGPNQLLAYYGKESRMEERLLWREHKRLSKERSQRFSLRCDLEYKLGIANEFLDEPRFYFPHNVDFRGRAYPMHPHLNHLGSDVCRGLLHFAEARPLGPRGLDWLRISVANLYGSGADKLPLTGRAEFAEEHMQEVFQTADDPLGPDSKWWLDADSPWQLLAVCIDLAAALRSGDPAAYCSQLPVHQDGSCNGLQHYAALGRDAWGGTAVNLSPRPEPQDVYSEIAAVVLQKVAADVASGNERARLLQDQIDRKLVKQTVMTSVYGVTMVGARGQICNRLKERGWTDSTVVFQVSAYAAKVVLGSLMDMFTGAKHIMGWLTECAAAVAKENHSVQWTTPLGLPVIQPYRNLRKQSVRTMLQHVVLSKSSDDLPVLKSRQRSAFPPNFIHSIDSSHMMLTAIACAKEGMAFAGVHDSFWTHAGCVDRMNETLREQFVELHSQPLLEQLLAEFQAKHPSVEFPPLPERGTLDLDAVRDSAYFFS